MRSRIRDILMSLKNQGPDDPDVAYIIKAVIEKANRDKTLNIRKNMIADMVLSEGFLLNASADSDPKSPDSL